MSENAASEYRSYRDLPSLAGLASMERAVECPWSVEQSVDRLKRLHYALKRLYETLTARITAEPIYELKTAMSHHAYLCAEYVTAIRKRVSEMREPPLGLDKVPHSSLQLWMDETIAAPTTQELLLAVYEVAIPAVIEAAKRLQGDAHPLADAPTVRLAKLMQFELNEIASFGRLAVECLVDAEQRAASQGWLKAAQRMPYKCGRLGWHRTHRTFRATRCSTFGSAICLSSRTETRRAISR